MSSSCNRWKSSIFGEQIYFAVIGLNILDKLLHALHTHTYRVNCCKADIFRKDRFSSVHRTLSLSLLDSVSCLYSSPFLFTLQYTHLILYIYTCTGIHTDTHTFALLPPQHTQTVAGFADVCLDLLPAEALLMPVCWLWVFHSLLWNKSRRH